MVSCRVVQVRMDNIDDGTVTIMSMRNEKEAIRRHVVSLYFCPEVVVDSKMGPECNNSKVGSLFRQIWKTSLPVCTGASAHLLKTGGYITVERYLGYTYLQCPPKPAICTHIPKPELFSSPSNIKTTQHQSSGGVRRQQHPLSWIVIDSRRLA